MYIGAAYIYRRRLSLCLVHADATPRADALGAWRLHTAHSRGEAEGVTAQIASGAMQHVVDKEFGGGLGEAQAAHEYMESNANLGKIVLKVGA